MNLLSLPCYCATLRQAARAVTVLYEDMIAGSGLHATQSTATRMLALIKKAGLASDTVGADRRQRRWALSAQGQALQKKLKPRWEAAQEAFEKRLGRAEAADFKQASHLAASRLSSTQTVHA